MVRNTAAKRRRHSAVTAQSRAEGRWRGRRASEIADRTSECPADRSTQLRSGSVDKRCEPLKYRRRQRGHFPERRFHGPDPVGIPRLPMLVNAARLHVGNRRQSSGRGQFRVLATTEPSGSADAGASMKTNSPAPWNRAFLRGIHSIRLGRALGRMKLTSGFDLRLRSERSGRIGVGKNQ